MFLEQHSWCLLTRLHLETVAVLTLLPHYVQNRVHELRPLRVVTFGPVVPSTCLTCRQPISTEKVHVWTVKWSPQQMGMCTQTHSRLVTHFSAGASGGRVAAGFDFMCVFKADRDLQPPCFFSCWDISLLNKPWSLLTVYWTSSMLETFIALQLLPSSAEMSLMVTNSQRIISFSFSD